MNSFQLVDADTGHSLGWYLWAGEPSVGDEIVLPGVTGVVVRRRWEERVLGTPYLSDAGLLSSRAVVAAVVVRLEPDPVGVEEEEL